MNVIEDKASKLLNRTVLKKIKKNSTKTDFSKHLELNDKYQKNDKFLIFGMNDRRLNNNPTSFYESKVCSF